MANGEEADVTFVGGRAIEQNEGLESNLEESEREEAKEAVRKAIQAAGEDSAESAKTDKAKDPYKPPGAKKAEKPETAKVDSASVSKEKGESDSPERGPDGKFLPKEGKPTAKVGGSPKDSESEEESELDVTKASVKELLKAREKIAAAKKEVKDEISKERQSFLREQQEFQRQQQEFQNAQRQLRQQYEALQSLKKDPARAIRELGSNPEEFIMDLAQEGTPEGIHKREMRELREQIASMTKWKEEQAQQAANYRKQQQHQQMLDGRASAVKEFVEKAMEEDKYPHVAEAFRGKERVLVAWGDLAAEEYRQLSKGREGSLEDILDYIEDQLAETGNSWYSKRSKKDAQVKLPDTKDSKEKPKSKGKTLSPDGSGERRTLAAKNLNDLDGDERLEAARQAVAIAVANSKED